MLVGLLLFILVMSLGMMQDAEFTAAHFLICSFVALNVGSLMAWQYAWKLTRLLAISNTVLLFVSLVSALTFVLPMDVGFGTCTFLIVFVGSAVFLLKENIRSIRINR